jgi:hypothetical protein
VPRGAALLTALPPALIRSRDAAASRLYSLRGQIQSEHRFDSTSSQGSHRPVSRKCPLPLMLSDRYGEGLGRLLAAHVDRCRDEGCVRRVLRSEDEAVTFVVVREIGVRAGYDTAPTEGISTDGAGVAVAHIGEVGMSYT